jgi:hypothetical protein
MKLTESQLRRIIREELQNIPAKKLIKESSAKDAYARLKELKKHANDFYYLRKISSQHYEDIRKLRDSYGKSYDQYEQFFRKMQQYGFQPGMVRAIFDKEQFSMPAEEVMPLMKEYETLSQRFTTKNVTDETDRAYGRKRFHVIDKESGEVVDEFTDRKGSLGS